MGLLSTVKGRASQQAGANTETQPASVVKTYVDAQGSVYAADVRLDGQPRPLSRIPNGSGLRLWIGMHVTVNWARGNRHDPVILAAAGSESGAAIQAASGSGTTSGGGGTSSSGNVDLSGTAFLVASPDESLPGAYTEQPGANVLMVDVDPVGDGSGSGPIGGTRTIHAVPLVVTTLPSPSGLLDGTCVDLVDGDGNPNGMYRLLAGVWVRRDTPGAGGGGGGSGVTSADRTRWNSAGTNATQALTNAAQAETDAQTGISAAAAAQSTASTAQSTANTVTTEVTNARTRDAVGAFAAQSFTSLKAHFAAMWSQIATLKTWIADPTGVTVGWVLTRTSGGVAWQAATSGGGSGTVTSVDGDGGSTGLTVSGGPITGSGTLVLGGTLAIAHGGTAATDAAAARANLAAAPLAWAILELATTSGTPPAGA